MKQLWLGVVALFVGAYVLMNWPALATFADVLRSVGPGFGW